MSSKNTRQALIRRIKQLTPDDDHAFEELALQVFQYQAKLNPVYRRFLKLLGRSPAQVQTPSEIPFLPIELFKTKQIKTGRWQEECVFTSSGTTGTTPSRHFLRTADFYRRHALRSFELFYGPIQQYTILALLPSYLERKNSSLVFMVQHFIEQSKKQQSGFFLNEYEGLRQTIEDLQNNGQSILLIGVTFALLEFAEQHPMQLNDKQFILMETGGMKGRGPEYTRAEVHEKLKRAFGLRQIHSEYGMTELLSQAYSKGKGLFKCPPQLRIRIRDLRDPFAERQTGHSGGINIIDLANLDSCSFIATQDIGLRHKDSTFEVLGRSDDSELRGCNLMVINDAAS